jgi:hypothetical protein
MAMITRQSTKTITMPSATMASATEESVLERVTQRKPEGRPISPPGGSANERLVCDL